MLGFDAVTTAVVQGGRTAAEQIRLVPWGEPREPERPLVVGSEVAAWPGSIPPPFPARVFDPPLPAELVDSRGDAIAVNGRGEQVRAPAQVWSRALPGGGGAVQAWAGPWAHDVRWWDPLARRRCARWQVIANDVACIVVVEGGRAGIEAIYD
jgi:protein ImuB